MNYGSMAQSPLPPVVTPRRYALAICCMLAPSPASREKTFGAIRRNAGMVSTNTTNPCIRTISHLKSHIILSYKVGRWGCDGIIHPPLSEPGPPHPPFCQFSILNNTFHLTLHYAPRTKPSTTEYHRQRGRHIWSRVGIGATLQAVHT
jgi:hypothetical protein